jgi:OFA family oxalate/formate antiporter-like MFS transporter
VHRWVIAGSAVLTQFCLGIIYAWPVFRGPLERHYGWTKTESVAPYGWSILCYTLGMIVAGFLQDRKGPRLAAAIGGALVGAGCLLAGYAGDTPLRLKLSYGVLLGLGVGFAYVAPISTCVKWFPDKRGLVVGLAVMGFGLGPLGFAPLLEWSLGDDPTQFGATIPRTFFMLAVALAAVVMGCAQVFRVPPKGWKPAGWTPPGGAGADDAGYEPGTMLRTRRFYVLWVVYFLGCAIGLTVIGESAPLVREMSGAAVMSGGMALGVMSLFNGLGRLAWGALSDQTGRLPVVFAMFTVAGLACAALLPGTRDFWRVLAGLSAVGFSYGGFLALMPAFSAEYFGARRIGANYGLLFTAYGTAGFTVPRWAASVIESQKQAGAVQAGYDRVFYTLAALAAAGIAAALLLRRRAR